MKTLHLDLPRGGYDIYIGSGILSRAAELFDLRRRVIVLTDTGVPEEYAKAVAALADEARIVTLPMGEGSKSFSGLETVCREMLDFGLTRTDCLISVGGGVVGDLGGFAAASYMRGIDFYNVPTTLLSQLDSSIGGKTAINLDSTKNIIGAFHQPRAVLIDTETLKTLPGRQISAGLAEAVKMAVTSDAELFGIIEREGVTDENLETVILRSLMIKKAVVEEDERESGLRKVLNFGHTLGHGIEAVEGLSGLYHGECVALGMIPMCGRKIRERVYRVLSALSLPMDHVFELDAALSYISRDKKCSGDFVSAVFADDIGSFRIEKMPISELVFYIREQSEEIGK